MAEQTDIDGNYTGEYLVSYSAPTKVRMNVSPNSGSARVEEFGIDNRYTKVLVTQDNTTQFDTDTVFWIGIEPTETYTVNGVATQIDVPYNYVVTSVARGLEKSSLTRITVKEVDVQ